MHENEPVFDKARMLEVIAIDPTMRAFWRDSDKSFDTLEAMFNSFVVEGPAFELYQSWGATTGRGWDCRGGIDAALWPC